MLIFTIFDFENLPQVGKEFVPGEFVTLLKSQYLVLKNYFENLAKFFLSRLSLDVSDLMLLKKL